MLNWIEHHGLEALAFYYLTAAFFSSFEAPDANSTKFYRWWYKFANTIGANLPRAFATLLPSGRLNTAENAAKEPEVLANLAAPISKVISQP